MNTKHTQNDIKSAHHGDKNGVPTNALIEAAQLPIDATRLDFQPVLQPEDIQFYFEDGVFVKQLSLERVGYCIPGHKHEFSHTSMLAKGSVRMWRDGQFVGDFHAPTGIKVDAGAFHMFMALEDNTLLFCIHNTHGFPEEELEAKLVTEKNTAGFPYKEAEPKTLTERISYAPKSYWKTL